METTNHEYYVSPEVAKLLEKAGFDWRCRKCYNKGVLFDVESDEIREQCPQHSSYDVLAPTLEVAQRWLREVKNIYLYTYPDFVRGSDINPVWQIKYKYKIEYWSGYYDTYEEAIEAGIKRVLKIILEKGE